MKTLFFSIWMISFSVILINGNDLNNQLECHQYQAQGLHDACSTHLEILDAILKKKVTDI